MDMSLMAPGFSAMDAAHSLSMLAMWTVMMIGMMTPSVAPMILLYAQVARRQRRQPFAPAGWFAGGYLLAWTGFSAAGDRGAMGPGKRRAADADDGKRKPFSAGWC